MKKPETERDSSLERLMRRSLQARVSKVSDTSDTSGCLDAATLAGWAEQTLSVRERSAAEAHAADCARCQAMLAAMVRATPADVQAPWWRVHMMAWMVPMSAATAALIIWAVLPGQRAAPPARATAIAEPTPPANPPPIARAEPSAAALPPRSPMREVAGKETGNRQVKDDALRDASGNSASLDQRVKQRKEFRRADVNEGASSSLAKTEATPVEPKGNVAGDTRAKAMEENAALAPPPAAAGVAQAKPAAAPAAPPSAATAQERSVVGEARAAQAAAAPRDAADRLLSARAFTASAVAPIVSPNPQNRWRLLPGGAVQHSTDGGATWQTQQTGATTTLTAGVSPAPLVCWLVGSGGRVLLSTDGATWKQVSLSQPIDLVSVRATDDKSATVTASDGRSFTTADAGVTWRPR